MMTTEAQGGRYPRLIQAAIDAFSLPDLRAKILFTLAILALYRFIAHIPLPGIDQVALDELFRNNQLLGFLDLFSGGALSRMSIVALGVFPYITASIVIQLLTPVIPSLQELAREGEAGRAKMNRIVHWLTVPIALAQGYGQLVSAATEQRPDQRGLHRRRRPAHDGGPAIHRRRDHVPGVAGRVDHRTRHRERYLVDHIRGYRGRIPKAADPGVPGH